MFPLIYLPESLHSTNEVILKYHNENTPNFGLYTFHQINGKGQYGSKWITEKNQNLAYSLLIQKKNIATPSSLFNFHTAMIVRDFLANLTKKNVSVKWPNDIIINRKKVGGILIEQVKIQQEFYYIIGIGINILQEKFDDLSKAGSLYTQTLQRFSLTEFTEKFHSYFSENITKSEDDILDKYNAILFGKNQVSLFSKNGIRQNGIIQYVDKDGFLWIDLEKDGIQKFFHKEIEMLF